LIETNPVYSSNEKDEIARWREMPASIFSMILILGIKYKATTKAKKSRAN
jgi:hypothetical protein